VRYRFKTAQWVPYSAEHVFAFFADPNNLPLLSLKWQRLRIEEAMLAPPPPRPALQATGLRLRSFAAGKDSIITVSYRPLRWLPIRFRWKAQITHFEWNRMFADIGVDSIFPYWEHCHIFEVETRANTSGVAVQGTLIKDEINYIPPGQGDTWLTRKFHDHVVLPTIKRMFKARHKQLALMLPSILARLVPPSAIPAPPAQADPPDD